MNTINKFLAILWVAKYAMTY